MIKGLKDFLIMLYEDFTKKIIGCAMKCTKDWKRFSRSNLPKRIRN